jgi:hypothetical protein
MLLRNLPFAWHVRFGKAREKRAAETHPNREADIGSRVELK